VGAGDGSVWVYRNIGTRKEAKYAAGVALLPACKRSWNPVPADQEPDCPGLRCKICVTDWNGDGRLDLLVGDYWSQNSVAPKLTPEETKRRDELKARRDELNRKWGELYQKLEKDGKEDQETDDLKNVQNELGKVHQELQKLEPRATSHGSVWLYIRKAEGANGK
jgi:hypothetical protein